MWVMCTMLEISTAIANTTPSLAYYYSPPDSVDACSDSPWLLSCNPYNLWCITTHRAAAHICMSTCMLACMNTHTHTILTSSHSNPQQSGLALASVLLLQCIIVFLDHRMQGRNAYIYASNCSIPTASL